MATLDFANTFHRAKISIHTTLAGGDKLHYMGILVAKISIHTTLAGGDPYQIATHFPAMRISIHTTLAGGDSLYADKASLEIMISIHTTLAGGDSKNGREIHPFSIPIKA